MKKFGEALPGEIDWTWLDEELSGAQDPSDAVYGSYPLQGLLPCQTNLQARRSPVSGHSYTEHPDSGHEQ